MATVWVGEEGPELFIPASKARVLTIEEIEEILRQLRALKEKQAEADEEDD